MPVVTPPLALCIAGPTASGKSALALRLAQEVGGEIISVDSAQVYRGLDIGTAKPSAAERAAVPHHLIDITEPSAAYSAAQFAAAARHFIDEIRSRGHVPLLVGGTMLYFKALRDGLSALPQADAALRAQIDAQARELGWPAMHAQLAQVDAASAARLAPNDAQRIQRALEVFALSGRALSSLQGQPTTAPLPLPMLALEPAARAWLHERIAQRFDAMLQAGLVAEVQRLRARGDLNAAMPSMRCVGYRQAWAALDAGNLAALRETGIAATRQLAKRQLTWLRSMPRTTLACDAPSFMPQALAQAKLLLAQDT